MEYRVESRTGERHIQITLPPEPFALWLSGGFDSTLLLYLLCREKPRYLAAYNVARGGGTDHYARRAVEHIGARFGSSICLTEIEPALDRDAHYQINAPMEEFLRRRFVNHIFTGVTSNPDGLPGGPNRPLFETPGHILPFLKCDKSHTVALAAQLDVLDEIALLSHSCTERSRPEERCGQCWQCQERAWAFAINGLEDARERALL